MSVCTRNGFKKTSPTEKELNLDDICSWNIPVLMEFYHHIYGSEKKGFFTGINHKYLYQWKENLPNYYLNPQHQNKSQHDLHYIYISYQNIFPQLLYYLNTSQSHEHISWYTGKYHPIFDYGKLKLWEGTDNMYIAILQQNQIQNKIQLSWIPIQCLNNKPILSLPT